MIWLGIIIGIMIMQTGCLIVGLITKDEVIVAQFSVFIFMPFMVLIMYFNRWLKRKKRLRKLKKQEKVQEVENVKN